MKLRHKVALMTGGSTGIGKAIVKRFLYEGAQVFVFGQHKPLVEGVTFFEGDVTSEKDIKAAISEIDRLDILVNNAGIYFQASVEETEVQQLDQILNVNVKGVFLMCKHALGLLKKTNGNIITISSCLGVVPEPEAPAYCATKAATIMLMKTLSQAYANDRVRVNAVLPGPIDTPLLDPFFESGEDKMAYFARKPFGRLGQPQEVANVVAFLASSEASFITGATYAVDGGESASSLYTK